METHRFYLEAAMEEAEQAYIKKTYPVGTVIVNPNGKIISRGHNHVYSKGNGDFTAHAEVEAIREAGPLLMQKGNFENCTLYTTWEPCLMCCGAILLARIKHVIWVMDDDLHGGLRRLCKNKHLLESLYYEQKLVDTEISSANEQDLVERMETWMKDWNEEKETVLNHWRQPIRLSPAQYPMMDRANQENLTALPIYSDTDNSNEALANRSNGFILA